MSKSFCDKRSSIPGENIFLEKLGGCPKCGSKEHEIQTTAPDHSAGETTYKICEDCGEDYDHE